MAVNQITSQFRTQYNDEFKFDYEREPSLLKQTVRNDGAQHGSTVKWDVVDPSDAANVRTRDGLIPVSQLGLSQATGTMEEHFKKYQIDSFDLFRANPNTRAAQARKGRASINKSIDTKSLIVSIWRYAFGVMTPQMLPFHSTSAFISWETQVRNVDLTPKSMALPELIALDDPSSASMID